MRVEVEEVSVSSGSGNAQDVLKRLLIVGSRRQRFDLGTVVRFCKGRTRPGVLLDGGLPS